MKLKIFILTLAACAIMIATSCNETHIQKVSNGLFYNVLDYGAVGDGQTNNTKAINTAIETAAKNGGGTVFFPAGDYLSFTIHLKSKITLHLDQGAVLIGDKEVNGAGYDLPEKEILQDLPIYMGSFLPR